MQKTAWLFSSDRHEMNFITVTATNESVLAPDGAVL